MRNIINSKIISSWKTFITSILLRTKRTKGGAFLAFRFVQMGQFREVPDRSLRMQASRNWPDLLELRLIQKLKIGLEPE